MITTVYDSYGMCKMDCFNVRCYLYIYVCALRKIDVTLNRNLLYTAMQSSFYALHSLYNVRIYRYIKRL